MRANVLPLHLPSYLTIPAGSTLLAGDSMNGRQIQWTGRKKAALYRQYSYGILLVQLCCTVGATMLALLVWLCWTLGIAMLNLWYSYAEPLVPGCFTLLVLLFQFVYRQYQGEFFSNPRQNSRKTDANPKQKQEFSTSNPKQHAYIYPLNAWAGNISLTLAENCAILNVFSRSM